MHGKGSLGDKRDIRAGAGTLKSEFRLRDGPCQAWNRSQPERGKNRPLLSPTVLALSPCRTPAEC